MASRQLGVSLGCTIYPALRDSCPAKSLFRAGQAFISEKADLARQSSNAAESCCGEFGAHFGGLCRCRLSKETCTSDTVRRALRTGPAAHSYAGEPCRVCPLTNLGDRTDRRFSILGSPRLAACRLFASPSARQAGLHLFGSQLVESGIRGEPLEPRLRLLRGSDARLWEP